VTLRVGVAKGLTPRGVEAGEMMLVAARELGLVIVACSQYALVALSVAMTDEKDEECGASTRT
jgi:hypothetical protein